VPTAFLTHSLFLRHEVPTGHPERPRRLSAIVDELITQRIYDLLRIVEAPEASNDALCRVHSPAHVSAMEGLKLGDAIASIDADTFVGPHSVAAARHAAGAAIEATELVIAGRADSAFCCVRPPGHHAERDRAMGFCLFNNVAVGVAYALDQRGLERIAIVDFDVHHGNGTEDIFAGDSRVLFCSSFQHPFYPHSSTAPRDSNIIKVPLRAGCSGREFRDAISDHWAPAIERFAPEMIFVSAGFDGHAEDTMAGLLLLDDDYRWISDWIVERADRYASGRIVSCLEGGYALDALARCATLHIRALAGL
jgi:acetoin utilization deacetylase AcuC-like enzyme